MNLKHVWGAAGQVSKDWAKAKNEKREDKAKDWSDVVTAQSSIKLYLILFHLGF